MNKFAPVILGTDEDLIRDHLRQLDERHHDDDATPEDLAKRIRAARKYIRRSCRRSLSQDRKLAAFVRRLLAGSVLFLLWAISLAFLVG